jgi:hexosaminidase
MLRFKTVYDFEPLPDGVDANYILGGQGNLWTESVPTFRHAEYMLWPRSFALSEVLWSEKADKNWNQFVGRTEAHLKRLSKSDINYATSFYDAIVTPLKGAQDSLLIQVDTELEGLDIYYSFENVYPDHHTPKYNKGEKLSIPKDADTFRVITYRDGKPLGKIITISIQELIKRLDK